ncbi:oligosaccharide flippase family protein [Paracraurococcus lichenis]|uniref:Oligosaccharide flippase family protein n=1 Tax=Paracraurococcus lichenis TaxID=3064888 RepID=A0ABT9E466_9PROT|nr:oligosaccharide flippase family protein [Paracraurococcus sp. LOR1-02]MDO9710959.1 oligosaccharide flippase family protein [Paracraurococcus sp. LOR1-02]
MQLRIPSAHAPIWVLAETVAAAAFSLVSMLAVGAVIGPHAAGTGTVAMAAFLIAEVLVGALFPDALVRLARLEPRHADSAATASVLLGALGGVLLAALGPFLAEASGEPEVAWLALALAPLLPLSAFSGTASGLYLRDQRFRLLSARLLLGQPVALAVGLALARQGYGAWAMIAAQAIATIVTFLLMLHGRPGLRPRLDRAALADLWPVALPQLGGAAVLTGKYRIFLMALGLTVVPGVLAVSHFAFRLVDAAVGIVWQTVTRIAMPRLCALQEDPEALAETYGDMVQFQALLGLPICLGIALTAPDVVALLLGPRWEGMAGAAQVVALGATLTFLYGDTTSLFVALGKARWNFRVAVATLALPLAVLLLTGPETPEGAALAWTVPSLALPPVLAVVVLRTLDRSLPWLLGRLLPGLAAAVVMVAAVLAVQEGLDLAGWPRLLAAVGAGALAYGGVALAALGGRLPRALQTQRPRRPARDVARARPVAVREPQAASSALP